MTLRLLAPAKLNLTLRVGPPLSDGRHPLDSLVAFTNHLGDTLEIDAGEGLKLSIDGPFGDGLAASDDNLVLKAAIALAAHLGKPAHATLRLTKNLPIASGIGGGSADAAAALIGLNDLWQGGLSRQDLAQIAASLGADVPACVVGHPLRMTGTGETTQEVEPLPRFGIILVNPMIPCPTGPVYKQFDTHNMAQDLVVDTLPPLTTQSDLLFFLKQTPNDLERPAIELVPEIAGVLTAIRASPKCLLARMSGSGATCFGLYARHEDAVVAAADIKNGLASSPVWVEADTIN
jgi:4-diphosphocytidyl-2-C-methyl-D-erythritol kinase